MHPTPDALARMDAQSRALPVATFPAPRARSAQGGTLGSAVNLLSTVGTTGAIRDQGSNGDCWVWASSALAESLLRKKYGFQDQLSVEFVDSLVNSADWRDGGNLTQFSNYVNNAGILVPWSNGNGAYLDGVVNGYCTGSQVPYSAIQKVPAYTNVRLTPSRLATDGTQDQAIASIKNALDNGYLVAFTYHTQFKGSGGFDDFWDSSSGLWPTPVSAPASQQADSNWGGHVVAIVGYDDSDPTPANRYWIVMNSWGTSTNHPDGCFKLPMYMNYGATFYDSDPSDSWSRFVFETLDLTIAAPSPSVTALSTQAEPLVGLEYLPLTLKDTATANPPCSYQWRCNGADIQGATSAYYHIPVPVASGANAYTLAMTPQGGSTFTSSDLLVTTQPTQQLLVNPGFEEPLSGQSIPGWQYSSLGLATGYQIPYRNHSDYAHQGAHYAYLGNTLDAQGDVGPASGQLWQTVAIPSSGSPQLTYWMRQETRETSARAIDTLAIQVRDTQGNRLATLRTHDNQETTHLNWASETVSLAPYAGQTVQICLAWNCPSSMETVWRVDDLALTMSSQVPAAPTLASVSPTTAYSGQNVTLSGSGFFGTATVLLGSGLPLAFTVNSNTQITATMPIASASGLVTVANLMGSATSSSPLTVKTLDFSNQGTVDVLSMATLCTAFGSHAGSSNWVPACDLDGDGTVDGTDVALFLAHF